MYGLIVLVSVIIGYVIHNVVREMMLKKKCEYLESRGYKTIQKANYEAYVKNNVYVVKSFLYNMPLKEIKNKYK